MGRRAETDRLRLALLLLAGFLFRLFELLFEVFELLPHPGRHRMRRPPRFQLGDGFLDLFHSFVFHSPYYTLKGCICSGKFARIKLS